jgi:hypothetical protein
LEKNLINSHLELSSIVVAASDALVEAEVDQEVLALSIERGTCYGMNSVASRLWKFLAKPIRVRDLCAAMVATYRVDPEVCERQVLELLQELRIEGLIRLPEHE